MSPRGLGSALVNRAERSQIVRARLSMEDRLAVNAAIEDMIPDAGNGGSCGHRYDLMLQGITDRLFSPPRRDRLRSCGTRWVPPAGPTIPLTTVDNRCVPFFYTSFFFYPERR